MDCIVSVICIAYNHVCFIEKAIESFLSQETNFIFEIIIHDDASTDGTSDIVRQYQKKYPDMIKTIIQNKNQFSINKIKPLASAVAISRGKYIAICEGDDYWIDRKKLSKQVEALDRYAKCDICFHPALLLYAKKTIKINYIISSYSNKESIFSLGDFITRGGGFCPTASLMFRRHILEELPEWIGDAATPDYYIQVLGAKRGGGIYLPSVMSVYHYDRENSMTTLARKRNIAEIERDIEIDIILIDKLSFLLQKEQKENVFNLLAKRKSAIYMENSLSLLNKGDFDGFKKLIECSWTVQQSISFIQKIAYKVRRFPFPLMLVLRVKRLLFPIFASLCFKEQCQLNALRSKNNRIKFLVPVKSQFIR